MISVPDYDDVLIHQFISDRLSPDTCRMCGRAKRMRWHLGTEYHIEHDDFIGVVIGEYKTLEGKKGVVLQQNGTRVVHVYGDKWLK